MGFFSKILEKLGLRKGEPEMNFHRASQAHC